MFLITLVQVIISILLMIVILLQSKGGGLGRTFGSEAAFYHTKRGVEKIFFILTIILTLLFFIVSILNFIIK